MTKLYISYIYARSEVTNFGESDCQALMDGTIDKA